ncbi:uncharacterized protein LOC114954356 [Acropora millepora]|uniref:uncharacterized protein LOC114954356 n=1 Tax=Acropora millepora TaxID=45264 RepID=UPI001CF49437|nr:uncharacterized protein LOC114954356 [Acropora millepora]
MMSFGLLWMLFGILVFCPEAEGESLTWNEPPPKQTVQANLFRPPVRLSSRELHEATINASLIWQFTLTALSFTGLHLSFNGIFFGNIGPLAVLRSKLKHRFGLDWNHNQSIIRLIIFNVTSEETGTYSCKVLAKGLWDYEFESNVQLDVVNVKVDDVAPPMVTVTSKVYVGREQAASLICEVKGNPTPTISWSPCYGRNVICNEQYFNISIVQTARANYTCTANNTQGVDSATTLLLIGGKNVYLRLSLAGECNRKDPVWMTLQKELGKVFSKTQGFSGAELIDVRCESLIFDVVLKFGFRVAEDDTVSMIQSVIVDGKLGGLRENVSYIIGIPPVKQSTTMAPISITTKSDGTPSSTEARSAETGGTSSAPFTTEATSAATGRTSSAPFTTEATSAATGSTASAPSTGEPTSAGTEGSAGPQWTIIGAVEGGIVVLAIVVVVVPWWVHKRRKRRKDITICNSELELRQADQGVHLHVQCAQSGPLVENGSDGAAEQQKEVAGYFQNPGIATVSISPQPLPAIKEAYPYERMDYADITYLPKGNATLPPDDGNGGGNETETSKQKQGSRRD